MTLRDVPVRRAAVYAPSGRHPYPSSVVMGAVTARAAGVDEVYVASAPHPVILAAARLCEVDAVYRVTGAQAIAALAYGTESIPKVDVIVGPGNLYVQEAKRQVFGEVGIDGFNGPSDLTVIASRGADTEALTLDLEAQAEHGEGSLTVAVSDDDAILDALPGLTIRAADLDAALAFAEALAPEHLQLAGEDAEALAPRVRQAGCLFVGNAAGTAFGDYVAGSNHTLPTEGAARFASGLNVRHFRRRMAEVRLNDAAPALARAGVPIARPRGSNGTPRRWRCVRIHGRDPHRDPASQDRRDRRRAHADARRQRARGPQHRRRLPRPHARPAGPPRQAGPRRQRQRRSPDRLAPHRRGHRDRARAGARPGARRPPRDRPLRPCRDPDGRGARRRHAGHLRPAVRADRRLRAPAAPARSRASSTRLAEEFFRALASAAKLTLHVELQAGTNAHHMIEACFKALARALRQAIAIDPGETGVPSTKGTLT